MPKTANKLPTTPFSQHLDTFTNAYEFAAMWAAKSAQARGYCLMYVWYAWLFPCPNSLICHWERPASVADVAPPMHKLWPEYLDESSPREVARCFMWLTKVTLSRALPLILKKGASGEDPICWCCCSRCQASHAPQIGVLVHPMMTGQP